MRVRRRWLRSFDERPPPSATSIAPRRTNLTLFDHHYREALARVTESLGLPFGYTLTVWASGALAQHFFGIPGPIEIGAFVGGAVSVYVGFGAIEYPEIRAVEPLRARRVVRFNAVPVVAAALVAGVDRAVSHPLWGWLLSGAVATGAYISLLALLWAWDAREAAVRAEREPPTR